MTWTDTDEFEFNSLLKRREQNKEEAGRRIVVKSLRELADSIESGQRPFYSLDVEYLRHETMGYPREMGPVYGYRYTFEVRDNY